MFPIANINFYLNNGNQENNLGFYNSMKKSLTTDIEKVFSESEIYEGIRLTYYCSNKECIKVWFHLASLKRTTPIVPRGMVLSIPHITNYVWDK